MWSKVVKWIREIPDEFIEYTISSILRTPALLMCEIWYNNYAKNLAVSSKWFTDPEAFTDVFYSVGYIGNVSSELLVSRDLDVTLSFIFQAITWLLVPYDILVSVYMYAISSGLLCLCYLLSQYYVEDETELAKDVEDASQELFNITFYKRQVVNCRYKYVPRITCHLIFDFLF